MMRYFQYNLKCQRYANELTCNVMGVRTR